jgi:hypothetical protein
MPELARAQFVPRLSRDPQIPLSKTSHWSVPLFFSFALLVRMLLLKNGKNKVFWLIGTNTPIIKNAI